MNKLPDAHETSHRLKWRRATCNVNNANIDCAMALIIICGHRGWMDGKERNNMWMGWWWKHRKAHFNFNHILRSARSVVVQRQENRFVAFMTNRESCLRAPHYQRICVIRHCSHELENLLTCASLQGEQKKSLSNFDNRLKFRSNTLRCCHEIINYRSLIARVAKWKLMKIHRCHNHS